MNLTSKWLLCCCVVKSLIYTCLSVESCEIAQSKCRARLGCGMALRNFFIGCDSVIYGEATKCTIQCRRALISLLSTEDMTGMAFINCDCNGTEFCKTQKRRVTVCTNEVFETIETMNGSSAVVSCTLARWLCEADTSCFTAIHYYMTHCTKMFEGDKCTERCNNSLDILYHQDKAISLRNCSCDGTEDYDCELVRYYTDTLCFKRPRKAPYITKRTGKLQSSNCSGHLRTHCHIVWFVLFIVLLHYVFLSPTLSNSFRRIGLCR